MKTRNVFRNVAQLNAKALKLKAVFLLLFLSVIAKAQLTADFASTTVCEGSTTFFTNASYTTTGTIVGWQWNFGDGAAVSTIINPTHTYATSGTFDVQLIVTDDLLNKDTIVRKVIVHAMPIAGFTIPSNIACVGDSVQFMNTSTSVDLITSFVWTIQDHADVYVDSTVNPTYEYKNCGTTFGTFINLTATTQYGCSDSFVENVYVSCPISVDAGVDTVVCYSGYQLNPVPTPANGTYTYSWYPSTGLDNAFIKNPTANHVHEQNYIVTMADGFGCKATDTVKVSSYNYHLSADTIWICPGQSAMLDFGSGGQYYDWINFIDIHNNVFSINDSTQTITVNQPGQYVGYATFAPCVGGFTNLFIVAFKSNCSDSLWPGDANHDYIANNADLLNIGIGYGETGPVRGFPGNSWIPRYITGFDWSKDFISTINYIHADCNGDGTINGSDTVAINLNYNKTHPYKTQPTQNYVTGLSDLKVEMAQTVVGTDKLVSAKITIGKNIPLDSLYGLAFTIQYDPSLVKPASPNMTYSGSVFGTKDVNMLAMDTNFYSNGEMDVAITLVNHTNLTNVSGTVCEFLFVTTDNLSGGIADMLEINLTSITAVTANGNLLNINTVSDSVWVSNSYCFDFSDYTQGYLDTVSWLYPSGSVFAEYGDIKLIKPNTGSVYGLGFISAAMALQGQINIDVSSTSYANKKLTYGLGLGSTPFGGMIVDGDTIFKNSQIPTSVYSGNGFTVSFFIFSDYYFTVSGAFNKVEVFGFLNGYISDVCLEEVTFTSIDLQNKVEKIEIVPNPSNGMFKVISGTDLINTLSIVDVAGRVVFSNQYNAQIVNVNLDALDVGVYFVQVNAGDKKVIQKIVIE